MASMTTSSSNSCKSGFPSSSFWFTGQNASAPGSTPQITGSLPVLDICRGSPAWLAPLAAASRFTVIKISGDLQRFWTSNLYLQADSRANDNHPHQWGQHPVRRLQSDNQPLHGHSRLTTLAPEAMLQPRSTPAASQGPPPGLLAEAWPAMQDAGMQAACGASLQRRSMQAQLQIRVQAAAPTPLTWYHATCGALAAAAARNTATNRQAPALLRPAPAAPPRAAAAALTGRKRSASSSLDTASRSGGAGDLVATPGPSHADSGACIAPSAAAAQEGRISDKLGSLCLQQAASGPPAKRCCVHLRCAPKQLGCSEPGTGGGKPPGDGLVAFR